VEQLAFACFQLSQVAFVAFAPKRHASRKPPTVAEVHLPCANAAVAGRAAGVSKVGVVSGGVQVAAGAPASAVGVVAPLSGLTVPESALVPASVVVVVVVELLEEQPTDRRAATAAAPRMCLNMDLSPRGEFAKTKWAFDVEATSSALGHHGVALGTCGQLQRKRQQVGKSSIRGAG